MSGLPMSPGSSSSALSASMLQHRSPSVDSNTGCCSSPRARNPIVDRGLDVQLLAHQGRIFLKWGSINAVLLSIVMYDLSHKCPHARSAWFYVEYLSAAVLALSLCYNFARFFYGRMQMAPIRGTVEQRRLLRFDDADASFVTTAEKGGRSEKATDASDKSHGMNASTLSWHSSFNDSHRSGAATSSNAWLNSGRVSPSYRPSSSSATYQHPNHSQLNASAWSTHNNSYNNTSISSPQHNNSTASAAAAAAASNSPFTSPYKNYNKTDIVTDEYELQRYMKSMSSAAAAAGGASPNGFAAEVSYQLNSSASGYGGVDGNDVNALNALRSYCNTAVNLLKTSLYQMAPTTVSPTAKTTAKDDHHHHHHHSLLHSGGGSVVGNSDIASLLGNVHDHHHATSDADESLELHRMSLNGQLTQSIYNLRGWLAVTIVQRLDTVIAQTNRTLGTLGATSAEFRGFTDVQVGKVGLDRLRRTAEVPALVNAYVPMLPKIVEFVQVSTNQEYLVQRVRDLAKGCVLADYRWNGGGTYNGVAWDEHLPTDAAIMFHMFCTYMDGQLAPLPQPGGRPFYSRYVVVGDKRSADEIKAEVRNKAGCAILCTNPQRPTFNLITTRTIRNSVQGRNNLFFVIVEFLVYMRSHNEGMLESVNLGRSGINLLHVIGD